MTTIKSYAAIVTENIQLREKIRLLTNQQTTRDLVHSLTFESLKKLMKEKCDWYEEQLQKTEKISSDAVAALKQTEKIIKIIESQ